MLNHAEKEHASAYTAALMRTCTSEEAIPLDESDLEGGDELSERPRKIHSNLSLSGSQWLLQAAETVFGSTSISPDIMTEEPAGRRRPLLLVAVAAAIEKEAEFMKRGNEEALQQHASAFPTRKLLQQRSDEAFDLVRFLLARGASLYMPSETGIFPLEHAIKKRSLRVCVLFCQSA